MNRDQEDFTAAGTSVLPPASFLAWRLTDAVL